MADCCAGREQKKDIQTKASTADASAAEAPAPAPAPAPSKTTTSKKELETPGNYRIVTNGGAGVTVDVSKDSEEKHKLAKGTVMNVLEVRLLESEQRVRGRIDNPPGWVSLRDTRDDSLWAEKESPQPQKQKLLQTQTKLPQTEKQTPQTNGKHDDADDDDDGFATEQLEKLKKMKTRFTRSKRFHEWVEVVFNEVDVNQSKSLDTNEIYIAVLKLYLKIAGICKGAIPPTRDDIDKLAKHFEKPGDQGHMDLETFKGFCEFLCGQIASRVLVQMILQMVIAPLLGLLVMAGWRRVMERTMPETYAWCDEKVPAAVVVTLFVGLGVSLFVPPLMNLIDRCVLKEAHAKVTGKMKKQK